MIMEVRPGTRANAQKVKTDFFLVVLDLAHATGDWQKLFFLNLQNKNWPANCVYRPGPTQEYLNV